jgi:hypothetical protein
MDIQTIIADWKANARVPLLGWAEPETVCHCLEQAVRKPTRRRQRRSLRS